MAFNRFLRMISGRGENNLSQSVYFIFPTIGKGRVKNCCCCCCKIYLSYTRIYHIRVDISWSWNRGERFVSSRKFSFPTKKKKRKNRREVVTRFMVGQSSIIHHRDGNTSINLSQEEMIKSLRENEKRREDEDWQKITKSIKSKRDVYEWITKVKKTNSF